MVILLVALYGCEIRSLTVKDEQKLKMFKNKVLRNIIVTKRDGNCRE